MRTRVYSPVVVYADIVIANQLRIHVIPIRIIGVYFTQQKTFICDTVLVPA